MPFVLAMALSDSPLFAELKRDAGLLAADLKELAALRWQLAQLELQRAIAQTRRLAILATAAAILGTVALSLGAVAAALALGPALNLAPACILGVLGLVLLVVAALVAWIGWRWFRRRFRGLEQSIEELREDLVWLEDWTARRQSDA